MTSVTRADQERLDTARSPLSAKNSMKTKMTAAMKNRAIQSVRRDHAHRAVDPVLPGLPRASDVCSSHLS